MWPFVKGRAAARAAGLPLFPLKTVLFPGGLLPLKVFEQRYIEMTKSCMAEGRPFGVCLILRGEEVATTATAQPQIATVGTLARVVDFDMPQPGILHLATEGGERFRVREQSVAAGGLVVGDVVPLAAEPAVELAPAFQPLANLLELIAARIGPQNFPAERNFADASWVGYRLAEVLPLPLPIKQSMLEINDAGVRLDVLQKFLVQQGIL